MNNFLVLMSGGTTPVINATLYGIIKKIKKKKNIKIYSGKKGIDGVLNSKFIDLTKYSKSEIKKMYSTPGSHFVGTTRLKKLNNIQLKILRKNLKKKKIGNVINIGGNGTLQQTIDFSKRIKTVKFISCPKTVDNDLGDFDFKKMYFNPGFISCVKIWKFFLEMINIENIGAQSHDKVIVSQTFGRDTGFICGSLRYWDQKKKLPMMLLLPEDNQNFKKILKSVKKYIKKFGRLMIFLSEGYFLGDIKPNYDKSGQIMFGSSGTSACQILSNRLNKKGIQTRIFNPTILQRVFKYKNDIIDHRDVNIAKKVGEHAVNLLLKKKKSFLIGISKNNKIIPIPFYECKNFNRKMPQSFIKKNSFDVSKKYLKYLKKIITQ